jgi:hypothetical protein
MSTGVYPYDWKLARVHPIPKKGRSNDPANFRPIALLSVLAKIFEALLNDHIVSFLEHHSLLSDAQYGFRRARSTGDLLAIITHRWAESLDRWGITVAVALDIARAFDRVWHSALLSKMTSYGFSGGLIDFFRSYLSDRRIEVVVDGATSTRRSLPAGVPQGSSLSASLFLLYINDLLTTIEAENHAYADDTTLYRRIKYKRAPTTKQRTEDLPMIQEALQRDLNTIAAWGLRNEVHFNPAKTKVMMINLLMTPLNIQLHMENTELTVDDHLDILGIAVSRDLSWREHLLSLVAAAAKKLGALFRVVNFFTPEQLKTIYQSNIRPCIEYCSHIWGGSSSVWLLDSIDRRAKRLIGEHELTNNMQSLQHRRKVAALSILYKIYHGQCSEELHSVLPPPARRARLTRAGLGLHEYAIEPYACRIERYKRSFFPRSVDDWNALPMNVFPPAYNLGSFKKALNIHLARTI